MGGTDPLSEFYMTDRAIEYFWGGPKLNWYVDAQGAPLSADDFETWTRDTTIDFGGYLTNGPGVDAEDGDEMFIGAPLGPRWSCWNLDICHGMGPDYGILAVEVATAPFFRRAQGTSATKPGFGGDHYDIPNPAGSSNHTFDWFEFPDVGLGVTLDGYAPVETFNHYETEAGFTFRITGEFSDQLSDTDTDVGEPTSGRSWDSGDGVMYFFRLFIAGKHASSSGFNFKIQAVRLSRAIEDDGTLI